VNEISSLVLNQNSEHQEVSRNMELSAEFVHEVPLGTIVEDASLGHTVDSQESGINVASRCGISKMKSRPSGSGLCEKSYKSKHRSAGGNSNTQID
jgi:phage-related protein